MLLILESSGGLNIWGHDDTDCDDGDLPYVKGDPVTAAGYATYKARRAECGAQGVGPCQLTWPPHQDRADTLGGCWRPDINCRVGFDILAGHLREHGTRDAFTLYNTGRTGPGPYAERAMALLPRWQDVTSWTP
ncbi:MAG: hypothetical protein ACRD0V_09200 [Acidimicrobiales bacterium]